MTNTTRNYWMHALSPIHVGTGRGVGYIDLPIAREKVTNWPYIPGSALKGVIADSFDASTEEKRKDDKEKKAAFGTAGDDNANAGALVFTDARLVCLPIQSFYGTFAWCTSPLVLASLLRDLEAAGITTGDLEIPEIPENPEKGKKALVTEGSALLRSEKLYLQDLDISAKISNGSDNTAKWAKALAEWVFPGDKKWQKTFIERFAILPEDIFSYLCEMGTQVDARIRIKPDTKTVQRGGLWYEEALPAEAILAGMAWCDRVFVKDVTPEQLMKKYCNKAAKLQFGGKSTVGRGRVDLTFAGGK